MYFCLYKTNKFLYDKKIFKSFYSNNIYVIGVGNLSVGGSGKTPFVKLLSKHLDKKNLSHCIITRGYKKELSGEFLINNKNVDDFSPQHIGDEPFMLAKELTNPTILIGNKLKNIKSALKKKLGSYAIIDDGYQSYEIKKNYNILLIDFSVSLENYRLLPAGVLREPLSEIKRANLIVFTKINLCSAKDCNNKKIFFEKYINFKKQSLIYSTIKPLLYVVKNKKIQLVNDVASLNKKNYVSFSGIGNPKSFVSLQKKICIFPYKNFVFKDHFKYSKKNLKTLLDFLTKNNINTILTTKKDYYKISDFFKSFEIYILDIEHELSEDLKI